MSNKYYRPNRYPSYYDSSVDDEVLDNELATHLNDGLMSNQDKIKLDKIDVESLTANVNASDLIVDDKHMLVTKEQIEIWNNKSSSVEYDEDRSSLVIRL